jgi:uncharacterized membrane protein SpoIIM required for sporulation
MPSPGSALMQSVSINITLYLTFLVGFIFGRYEPKYYSITRPLSAKFYRNPVTSFESGTVGLRIDSDMTFPLL